MLVNCKSKIAPYVQREGITAMYMSEIHKYPLLSKTEELKLLKKAHSKDEKTRSKAIEKLVNCHQRFVLSVAMKMASNADLMDLVIEGNIGLLNAIQRFDVKKDVKFITYAVWWIYRNINNYLLQYKDIVVPANVNKLRCTVEKARKEFIKENGRMPILEELQTLLKEKYNFNVTHLSDLEGFRTISIDAPVEQNDEKMSGENTDYVQVTSSNNINDDIYNSDIKTMVARFMNKLNEKDRKILSQAFGIGCIECSYETIAEENNLSKERIRQKVNAILEKLKKMALNNNIFEN